MELLNPLPWSLYEDGHSYEGRAFTVDCRYMILLNEFPPCIGIHEQVCTSSHSYSRISQKKLVLHLFLFLKEARKKTTILKELSNGRMMECTAS
jgi:hypothetical protein